MSWFKSFKSFLWVNKEGALIGGGVGLAMYWYIKAKGISLMSVAGTGLVDAVMSRSSLIEIAQVKVALTCILVGALIGIVLDAFIKPRK